MRKGCLMSFTGIFFSLGGGANGGYEGFLGGCGRFGVLGVFFY